MEHIVNNADNKKQTHNDFEIVYFRKFSFNLTIQDGF